jgi:hypothetical protein
MVGVLAIGFIANLLIQPVPAQHHEPPGTLTPLEKEAAA